MHKPSRTLTHISTLIHTTHSKFHAATLPTLCKLSNHFYTSHTPLQLLHPVHHANTHTKYFWARLPPPRSSLSSSPELTQHAHLAYTLSLHHPSTGSTLHSHLPHRAPVASTNLSSLVYSSISALQLQPYLQNSECRPTLSLCTHSHTHPLYHKFYTAQKNSYTGMSYFPSSTPLLIFCYTSKSVAFILTPILMHQLTHL